MHTFWLCFVPLFVAVDAFGTLPIFLGLTEGLAPVRVRAILLQSVVTAAAVAVLFLFGGQALLKLLGLEVADFMVAGGALLFVIAMSDLVAAEKGRHRADPRLIGAVPIGVPLITGPAVLTTCLLLLNQYGVRPTLVAVMANVALAGVVYLFAQPVARFLGLAGTRTLSKIASLLLASIAVMMVRKGVFAFIAAARG